MKTIIAVIQPWPKQCPEMKPAPSVTSSKLTRANSHPPTIDRGPPTEIISDSSSTSPPSSSTCLLACSLKPASCKTRGVRRELTCKGHCKIGGCFGVIQMTTTPASHNNLHALFSLIRHDERRGYQAFTWWICILFKKLVFV